MGVSGSGKTTVGVILAEQLGVPFADADGFHSDEAKAKMAAGHPLTDDDRAPWLRRLADWLADEPGGCVLACSALNGATGMFCAAVPASSRSCIWPAIPRS